MLRGKHFVAVFVLGSILLAGLLSQGCVTAGQYERLQDQLAKANETIDLKDQRIEELDAERLRFEEEVLALREKMNLQNQSTDEAEAIIRDLTAQLEAANSKLSQGEPIPGLEFFPPEGGGGVGIRVSDDVLFDSGSHDLKQSGKNVLEIVANKLKETNGEVRVVGHTDSDAVVKTIKKYPHGNIQLSAMRAISVRDYLKQMGVPPERMCIEGRGQYKPLVENTSSQNKQRNRRVEIILNQ